MKKEDELKLLGGLLVSSVAVEECITRVSKEMFSADNRPLFCAVDTTYKAGKDCRNMGVVAQALQAAEPARTLTDCCGIVGAAVTAYAGEDVAVLAAQLIEDSKKRQLVGVLSSALADLNTPAVSAEEVIGRVSAAMQEQENSGTVATLQDALAAAYAEIDARARGEIKQLSTGFLQLDMCGGLNDGDLIVIGAETSQGKTSFALSLTLHFLRTGVPVAYYSLEMSGIQLATRLLSAASGVPALDIRSGRVTDPHDTEKQDKAAEELRRHPLFIDEAAATCEDMLASIRRLHRTQNVKVAVIDYIQILTSVGRRRDMTDEQLLADMARKLKNLAKELGVVVIVLSQLNRSTTDHIPTLSRLRSSGQIAEAADIVILIYRPEAIQGGDNTFLGQWADYETHNAAQIIIAKNRNGALADFLCGFDSACTAFYPASVPLRSRPEERKKNHDEIPF